MTVAYGFDRCARDDNGAAAAVNDDDNGCDGGNEWVIEE